MAEAERPWHVMFFSAEEERLASVDRLHPLAERTGSELDEDVLVTVGYFRCVAAAEEVVVRLQQGLRG